jgi:hypothetical protein
VLSLAWSLLAAYSMVGEAAPGTTPAQLLVRGFWVRRDQVTETGWALRRSAIVRALIGGALILLWIFVCA